MAHPLYICCALQITLDLWLHITWLQLLSSNQHIIVKAFFFLLLGFPVLEWFSLFVMQCIIFNHCLSWSGHCRSDRTTETSQREHQLFVAKLIISEVMHVESPVSCLLEPNLCIWALEWFWFCISHLCIMFTVFPLFCQLSCAHFSWMACPLMFCLSPVKSSMLVDTWFSLSS